jgi:hypothetical protein
MKYPATHEQLAREGFRFQQTAPCHGANCGATIHWYLTPGGARIPMARIIPAAGAELAADITYQPHFVDCPNAKDFRRKK